jgi:hypothetical protein
MLREVPFEKSGEDVLRMATFTGGIERMLRIATACLVAGLLLPVAAFAVDEVQVGWVEGIPYDPQATVPPCDGATVCWSQAPGWNNGGASQDEVINGGGDPNCYLISELADDFPWGSELACTEITHVTAWYLTTGGPMDCLEFIINFIPDAGGIPNETEIYCSFFGQTACAEVSGYPGYPSYELCATLDEPCVIPDDQWMWLMVQAAYCRALTGYGQCFVEMHTYTQGFEVAFRSSYFSYPTWVPGSLVFGDYYDMGFELLSGEPTPVEESTWGQMKTLYH